MTAKQWVKKYNGWPESEDRFAESICEEVTGKDAESELANAASAYLESLERFRSALEEAGFEAG